MSNDCLVTSVAIGTVYNDMCLIMLRSLRACGLFTGHVTILTDRPERYREVADLGPLLTVRASPDCDPYNARFTELAQAVAPTVRMYRSVWYFDTDQVFIRDARSLLYSRVGMFGYCTEPSVPNRQAFDGGLLSMGYSASESAELLRRGGGINAGTVLYNPDCYESFNQIWQGVTVSVQERIHRNLRARFNAYDQLSLNLMVHGLRIGGTHLDRFTYHPELQGWPNREVSEPVVHFAGYRQPAERVGTMQELLDSRLAG